MRPDLRGMLDRILPGIVAGVLSGLAIVGGLILRSALGGAP